MTKARLAQPGRLGIHLALGPNAARLAAGGVGVGSGFHLCQPDPHLTAGGIEVGFAPHDQQALVGQGCQGHVILALRQGCQRAPLPCNSPHDLIYHLLLLAVCSVDFFRIWLGQYNCTQLQNWQMSAWRTRGARCAATWTHFSAC